MWPPGTAAVAQRQVVARTERRRVAHQRRERHAPREARAARPARAVVDDALARDGDAPELRRGLVALCTLAGALAPDGHRARPGRVATARAEMCVIVMLRGVDATRAGARPGRRRPARGRLREVVLAIAGVCAGACAVEVARRLVGDERPCAEPQLKEALDLGRHARDLGPLARDEARDLDRLHLGDARLRGAVPQPHRADRARRGQREPPPRPRAALAAAPVPPPPAVCVTEPRSNQPSTSRSIARSAPAPLRVELCVATPCGAKFSSTRSEKT